MSRRGWPTLGQALQLSPGVVDAGLSSLAGFAASLYAVLYLDSADLGAFALYLSASIVGGLLPQHLLFLPAQIAVLEQPPDRRTLMLRSTLRRGTGLSLLVAPLVAIAGLIAGGDVSSGALAALAAGAVALTLLVPAQDHVRSTLYLANRPRRAAFVSAWQLGLTLAALALLHILEADPAWVPLTALCIAGAGSLAAGLAMARPFSGAHDPAVSTRALVRIGRPLLPAALVQEATIFAAGALLVALTSAATLGSAEAARIISRPVQALSLGISRSLAPRLMEAGQARSPEGARSAAGLYVTVLGVVGVAYLAIAGWAYPFSPFVEVLPAAYAEDGLAAVFLVATILGAISQVPRGILLGASRGTTILVITTVASAVRLGGVLALSVATGAYALPLAHLGSIAVTGWLSTRAAIGLLRRP